MLLLNWYVQVEYGGFYQVVVKGIYKKYGMDVIIKMGGLQVNNMQILVVGQVDFSMGYDFMVMKGIEQGLLLVIVGMFFQFDLQGMMMYDDVSSLGGLKSKIILVVGLGQLSWWLWFKFKYGYIDVQFKVYIFNLQFFFVDFNIVQQVYFLFELFQVDKVGVKSKFFFFVSEGYLFYGIIIVMLQKIVVIKFDLVQCFVKVIVEGWKSYLEDLVLVNVFIKVDNKNMGDE